MAEGTIDARLDLQGISKSFSNVQVLNKITFKCLHGEVHALVGENGAGKSTLMKIISGVYRLDEGKLMMDGEDRLFNSPREAQAAGIAMIHQELSLAQGISVMENIFMGHLTNHPLGLINYKDLASRTLKLLAEVGLKGVRPEDIVSDLSVSQKQLVEIAKALSLDAKVIIMDEPTSSLSMIETENLLSMVQKLKQQGISIIYISHRLEEVFQISDRITVLRDGISVGTWRPEEVTPAKIVALMVGREASETLPVFHECQKDLLLEINDLSRPGKFANINLSLCKGEILGISGLVGAGRSDLALAIFGVESKVQGSIKVQGRLITIKSPADAIKAGIALVPEDRKLQSLFLGMTVGENIVIAETEKNHSFATIDRKKELAVSNGFIEKLKIRTQSSQQKIEYLSGGNQQKAVLAKWLLCNPQILILDEPTRGIDVGAKEEIYLLIQDLAKQGVGVILISSELPEVLRLSHRILVMREGRMAGELERSDATPEKVMLLATGQNE